MGVSLYSLIRLTLLGSKEDRLGIAGVIDGSHVFAKLFHNSLQNVQLTYLNISLIGMSYLRAYAIDIAASSRYTAMNYRYFTSYTPAVISVGKTEPCS